MSQFLSLGKGEGTVLGSRCWLLGLDHRCRAPLPNLPTRSPPARLQALLPAPLSLTGAGERLLSVLVGETRAAGSKLHKFVFAPAGSQAAGAAGSSGEGAVAVDTPAGLAASHFGATNLRPVDGGVVSSPVDAVSAAAGGAAQAAAAPAAEAAGGEEAKQQQEGEAGEAPPAPPTGALAEPDYTVPVRQQGGQQQDGEERQEDEEAAGEEGEDTQEPPGQQPGQQQQQETEGEVVEEGVVAEEEKVEGGGWQQQGEGVQGQEEEREEEEEQPEAQRRQAGGLLDAIGESATLSAMLGVAFVVLALVGWRRVEQWRGRRGAGYQPPVQVTNGHPMSHVA